MTVVDLLERIRQRAAAQGMTLTELARAAEMQPGNLRRMLMNTTASPRLGSVMRLLPPLQCQVDPAGAHSSGELVAFLDTERQRQGWSWEQLLAPIGLDINKTTASLSYPDRMSLDVFTRLADALHIDIELVDDPRSSKKYPESTATAPHPAVAPTAPERSGPKRRTAEECRLAERLIAVEKELAELRKAQADDAVYLAGLLEANCIPEAITFFARRVLCAPFEDADQAFDALEQLGRPIASASVTPTAPDTVSDRGVPCGPKVCVPDSSANPASDAGAGAPTTAARDPASDVDSRPEPEAVDVDVDLQPRLEHRRRYTYQPQRITLASVPDSESASRWQPKRRKPLL